MVAGYYIRQTFFVMLVVSVVMLVQCSNPLDINTPRRVTAVSIDSIITSPDFIGKPGDSLFAVVDGLAIAFATEIARPVFYNKYVSGKYYVAVQAIVYGINGGNYDILALRLDGIRDTGTYTMNSVYTVPKRVDPYSSPKFAGQYERKRNAVLPEVYKTGVVNSIGRIRVVKIDTDRGVMVGTFSFTGFNLESRETITLNDGAFRLQLIE